MNEESKKMEINEAALEGVSGGTETNPNTVASRLCRGCRPSLSRSQHRCSGGVEALAAYLDEHGVDSVKQIPFCPFYVK